MTRTLMFGRKEARWHRKRPTSWSPATRTSTRRRPTSRCSSRCVKEKKVAIDGVILVTHDEDGAVAVRQTGDNLGRKGAGWGAGVGLAVGLFAPPLLASVGVGAVAGGVIGKFVDHRVETEIHDKIGENLPPGSAGIIAVFDDEHRLGVEQALAARRDPLGRRDRQAGRRRAEGVARRGDGEVQPRPQRAADPGPELRWDDRTHARRVGPGLDDQHDAEAAGGRTERPARPHRRRRLRRTRRPSAARCRRRR